MPEITIGLYPDVGGSWLLGRVPVRGGRFLALTGAPLNATDAILCGLADHYILESQRSAVLDAMTVLPRRPTTARRTTGSSLDSCR